MNGRNFCRYHVGLAVQDQSATLVSAPSQNVIINNSTTNNLTNVNNITSVESNTNMINTPLNSPGYPNAACGSSKSRLASLLLSIFFGWFGVHRFYAGKIGTGVLYLLTGGLFSIGYIVDIFTIATGTFTDGQYLEIKNGKK